jgi:hypothetical protein
MRRHPRERAFTFALTINERCGAPMCHSTRTRRDVLQDRGADRRMKELKRPDRCEDLRRRQPIRDQLGNHGIKLGQVRRHRHLRACAEHRDRARQRDRVSTHSPQPR